MKLHLLISWALFTLSGAAFAADDLDGLLGYAANSQSAPADADSELDAAISRQLHAIDTQLTTELAPTASAAAAESARRFTTTTVAARR